MTSISGTITPVKYGCIESRLNGMLHNDNGPAVIWDNGSKEWWVNGKLHREDGPAVELPDGGEEWWVNGKLHREDGPAVTYNIIERNGYISTIHQWWVNGERIDDMSMSGEYALLPSVILSGKTSDNDIPLREYIDEVHITKNANRYTEQSNGGMISKFLRYFMFWRN